MEENKGSKNSFKEEGLPPGLSAFCLSLTYNFFFLVSELECFCDLKIQTESPSCFVFVFVSKIANAFCTSTL